MVCVLLNNNVSRDVASSLCAQIRYKKGLGFYHKNGKSLKKWLILTYFKHCTMCTCVEIYSTHK